MESSTLNPPSHAAVIGEAAKISLALHRPPRQGKTLAVLHAYCDDSGTDEKSKLTTVGCYIASVEEWDALIPKWKGALERHDVPVSASGNRIFHSADFSQPNGPYSHWPPERRIDLFQDLTSLIAEHVRAGFVGGLIRDDYHRAQADFLIESRIGSPFEACFELCILVITESGLIRPEDELGFVLEAGTKHTGEVEKAYKNLWIHHRGSLPFGLSPALGKAVKDVIPVQVADFIAYESYKELERKALQYPRKMRASLESVLRRKPHSGHWLDYHQMKEIADGFSSVGL